MSAKFAEFFDYACPWVAVKRSELDGMASILPWCNSLIREFLAINFKKFRTKIGHYFAGGQRGMMACFLIYILPDIERFLIIMH